MRMLGVSGIGLTAKAMFAHGSAHGPQVELELLPLAAGKTNRCPAWRSLASYRSIPRSPAIVPQR
jgi:hypothetical protein